MEHSRNRRSNNLRKHRKLMGYSLKDIGFLLDLKSTSRLSRWEKGKSFPSIKNLILLGIIYRALTDQFYFPYKKEMEGFVMNREKLLMEMKKPLNEGVNDR